MIWGGFAIIRNTNKNSHKNSYKEDFKVQANQRREKILEDPNKAFERGFMEGCTEEATKSECRCMYDFIEREVGITSFIEMSLEFVEEGSSDEFAELMMEGAYYCS